MWLSKIESIFEEAAQIPTWEQWKSLESSESTRQPKAFQAAVFHRLSFLNMMFENDNLKQNNGYVTNLALIWNEY